MALTIYPECERLPSMENNCWKCAAHDLCSSCKVMDCTNDEKEYVIGEMCVGRMKDGQSC